MDPYRELVFPEQILFKRQDAYQEYPPRIRKFAAAGLAASLSPAAEDEETLAVVLVDYQGDFVKPTGALPISGAQDDITRFLGNWFYPNVGRITAIYASEDTHLPWQPFFMDWWKDPQTGKHPEPETVITEEDVMKEVWVPVLPDQRDWSLYYVHQLKQQGRQELMIWPYHCMEGTTGHTLCAPVSEAIVYHSTARKTRPTYIEKGKGRTEFYGIFGGEVLDPEDPSSALNVSLIEEIMSFDKVYVAGESICHCVKETLWQFVNQYEDQPEVLGRVHVLKDCMSPVRHPSINFEALAERDLAIMQKKGINLVKSTDPVL